jgi:hypothetical protein
VPAFREWLLAQVEHLPDHPYTMHAHYPTARLIVRRLPDTEWATADDLHDLVHARGLVGVSTLAGEPVFLALNNARLDYDAAAH